MVLIKTKDIRAVLYSIVKQLKNNDEFRYTVFNSWTSITKLNESIGRNEITAIRIVSNIRKVVARGKDVSLFINGVKICDISKVDNNIYVIRDSCGQLLEYILFEMISECNYIKVKFAKKDEIKYQEIKYHLDATYSREHIINVENSYDTFSHISIDLSNKLKSFIVSGEEYNVNVISRFIRSDCVYEKLCNINFEFKITM